MSSSWHLTADHSQRELQAGKSSSARKLRPELTAKLRLVPRGAGSVQYFEPYVLSGGMSSVYAARRSRRDYFQAVEVGLFTALEIAGDGRFARGVFTIYEATATSISEANELVRTAITDEGGWVAELGAPEVLGSTQGTPECHRVGGRTFFLLGMSLDVEYRRGGGTAARRRIRPSMIGLHARRSVNAWKESKPTGAICNEKTEWPMTFDRASYGLVRLTACTQTHPLIVRRESRAIQLRLWSTSEFRWEP